MLMQESIKEVINIHKCNFFFNFMRACGPRASPCGSRAYAGRARTSLRTHYPGPPRVFPASRTRGPSPNCHPYFTVISNLNLVTIFKIFIQNMNLNSSFYKKSEIEIVN